MGTDHAPYIEMLMGRTPTARRGIHADTGLVAVLVVVVVVVTGRQAGRSARTMLSDVRVRA